MLMVFNVPNHLPPVSHYARETWRLHPYPPHAETHSIKPGPGDDLPWTRSTNGCQPKTGPNNMLQLSGPGTHGMQLPQPVMITHFKSYFSTFYFIFYNQFYF